MTPPMTIHQIHAEQTVAHERVTEAIRGTVEQKANSGPIIAEADRWDEAATQARNLRKQLMDDMLFTVDDAGNVSLATNHPDLMEAWETVDGLTQSGELYVPGDIAEEADAARALIRQVTQYVASLDGDALYRTRCALVDTLGDPRDVEGVEVLYNALAPLLPDGKLVAPALDAATVAAWMDARVAAYVEGKDDEVVRHFTSNWNGIKHVVLGLNVEGYS